VRQGAVSRVLAQLLCVALVAVGQAGCRTTPHSEVAPGPDASELSARVAAYQSAHQERELRLVSARATARTEVEGAAGAAFSRQLLLLERPASLRIEVLGLMGQRALVLATDGARYDVFRAGEPQIERGDVHPGVLWETAGIPLTPEAAVAVLLAIPEMPVAGDANPEVSWDGASGEAVLGFTEATFRFDGAGLLRGYRWHPDGHDWVVARYDDWRGDERFPYRINLVFPSSGGRVAVSLESVELNPELSRDLFRLSPRKALSSDAEGETQ